MASNGRSRRRDSHPCRPRHASPVPGARDWHGGTGGGSVRVVLLGRGTECASLDALVEGLCAGTSRTLVVRGDAGVGKSALIAYLIERASGYRIAAATGLESEMELAFGALHQLCAPLLD